VAFYRDVNSVTPTNRPDVVDAKSVIQSLRNLLATKKGEIPFNPQFGISIEDKLFDLMDDAARLEILTDIFDAVDRFEPRVKLRRGKSAVEFFEDDNKVEVNLIFSIIGFSDEEELFNVTQSFKR